jgi:hypothetical protein
VVLGPGATGSAVGGSRRVECGERVEYAFRAAGDDMDLKVFFEHREVPATGTVRVTGPGPLVAYALSRQIVPPQAASAREALHAFLNAADKVFALAAFMSELATLKVELGTGFEAAVGGLFDEVEADPALRAQLSQAEIAIAGRIVVPTGSTGLPATGLVSNAAAGNAAGRRTLVVHVNGVLTDFPDAVTNWSELNSAVVEATLPNTATGLAYNPSATLPDNLNNVRCILDALAPIDVTFYMHTIDVSWDLGAACPNPPDEIADVVEALRLLLDRSVATPFIADLAADLHDRLSSGEQIIMVPHSEGNLMLRNALADFTDVTPADRRLLTSISLGPVDVPSANHVTRLDCWMVKDEIFWWANTQIPIFDGCVSQYSPLSTFPSLLFQVAKVGAHALARNCGWFMDLPCAEDILLLYPRIGLHGFRGSYLTFESRDLLIQLLRQHKQTLDAVILPPPSQPSLCDAVVDFSGNQLPPGWALTTLRSAGISNFRLEAHPADGQALIETAGGVDAGTTTLTVSYDARHAYSFWGLGRDLKLGTPSGKYTSSNHAEDFEYGTDEMHFFALDPALLGHDTGLSVPFDDYQFIEQYRDGSVERTVIRVSDGQVVASFLQPLTGFILQNLTSFELYLFAHSDNFAWLDNLAFTCN